MSKRLVTYGAVSLAIALFVAGWSIYPLLVGFVTADVPGRVVVTSPYGGLSHRLWSTLPFGLLGLAIGFGTFFVGSRSSSRLSYRTGFLALLSVGLVAVAGWTRVLADWIATLVREIPIPAGVSISLSQVPLYQIGLFASACVLATAVALAIWHKKRQNAQ